MIAQESILLHHYSALSIYGMPSDHVPVVTVTEHFQSEEQMGKHVTSRMAKILQGMTFVRAHDAALCLPLSSDPPPHPTPSCTSE